MQLICPECRNIVDLSSFPQLAKGHVIECNSCGITLMVINIKENNVEVEIVDEMK